MNNLSDIKRRISSVKQTRQITGAMETISVAKMRKAVELYERGRAYTEAVKNHMRAVAFQSESGMSEYFSQGGRGIPLYIVIASDKGMCGAFNHEIFKLADDRMSGKTCAVMPVGLTAFERYGKCENSRNEFASCGAPEYVNAQRISRAVIEDFGKRYSVVYIVYSKMTSHSVWSAHEERLLPADESESGAAPKASNYEYEPNERAVIEKLVPLYVGCMINGALASSTAAEHSARRAAMSASTKSADEMINTLSIEYNRARQGAVTEQITEMIGSVSALGKSGGSK